MESIGFSDLPLEAVQSFQLSPRAMLSNPLCSTKESELERPDRTTAFSTVARLLESQVRSAVVVLLGCCALATLASGQVNINAGSGAGAFQCNEGAAPTFTGGTDVLWCDSSHYF